jgi:hypothetical protein
MRLGTRQSGSFDLEEALLVERLANLEDDAVPQLDVAMQPRTPHIEIAITQARLFARRHFILDLKGGRF